MIPTPYHQFVSFRHWLVNLTNQCDTESQRVHEVDIRVYDPIGLLRTVYYWIKRGSHL
ncbi:hypothetical protein [Thermodesulfovibrio sp.]|uniref:hypothetical protein n=1 Tax=Thermodesulfovibrio sp. TaxID=2067987 RepID=UPI0030A1438F